jgi:hypothetical protein
MWSVGDLQRAELPILADPDDPDDPGDRGDPRTFVLVDRR